jgi:chromosome partitioning protein
VLRRRPTSGCRTGVHGSSSSPFAAITGTGRASITRCAGAGTSRLSTRRTANDVVVDRIDSERLTRLPQILAALDRRGFTITALDTAGIDSTGGNLAMRAADLCLVPARPTRLDLAATLSTIESLLRLGLKDRFAFVLNQCPPGRSSRATEAAAGLGAFGVLAEPMITQRADHQDALAAGQGVTEFSDSKAAEEIRALWGGSHASSTRGKLMTKPARPSPDLRPVAAATAA